MHSPYALCTWNDAHRLVYFFSVNIFRWPFFIFPSRKKMILKGIFRHSKLPRIVPILHRQRRIASGAFGMWMCKSVFLPEWKTEKRATLLPETLVSVPHVFFAEFPNRLNLNAEYEENRNVIFSHFSLSLSVFISFSIVRHTHVLFRFLFALSERIAWRATVWEKILFFYCIKSSKRVILM